MNSPRDVRILAWLYIVYGVAAILTTIATRQLAQVSALVALPIGIGLLGLRPLARLVALAGLWVVLIGLPVYAVLALPSQRFVATVFGREVTANAMLVPLFAVGYAFAIWQFRVLSSIPAREAFTAKRALPSQ